MLVKSCVKRGRVKNVTILSSYWQMDEIPMHIVIWVVGIEAVIISRSIIPYLGHDGSGELIIGIQPPEGGTVNHDSAPHLKIVIERRASEKRKMEHTLCLNTLSAHLKAAIPSYCMWCRPIKLTHFFPLLTMASRKLLSSRWNLNG